MPCPRSNHCHQPPVAACLQEKGRIRENTSCRHTQHYTEPPITPTFLWERWFHREFPGNAGIVAERPLPQLDISTRQHPIQCHRRRSPCSHGGKRPTHHHASMNACREKSVLGGTGREGRGNSPRNTRDSPRVACRCAKRLTSWASRTGPASGPQSRNRALLQWRAGVSRSPRP